MYKLSQKYFNKFKTYGLKKLGNFQVKIWKNTETATDKTNFDNCATKLRKISCKGFYRKYYVIQSVRFCLQYFVKGCLR